jgi:hypothetical protein
MYVRNCGAAFNTLNILPPVVMSVIQRAHTVLLLEALTPNAGAPGIGRAGKQGHQGQALVRKDKPGCLG